MMKHDFPVLKNDRFLKAARGEEVDKIPVWIMRQAGRYLPEFREFRTKHDFFSICQTPEYACEVTLQPIKRFDLDASIIFSDILVIPQAMVPLIGFTGAPWTLMGYMIQGGGSSTMAQARSWLYKYPQESLELLQLITDIIIDYLVMQAKSGAQALQVFESHADYLNDELFDIYSLPFLKKISEQVKLKLDELGIPRVPMIAFPKGATLNSLERLAKTEAYDVIGIDWTVEPSDARTRLAKATVQGNMDPCAMYASEEQVYERARKIASQFSKKGYIANLGHGILPDTPIASVEAFIRGVHSL
ncbi:Similar to Urod: Uroporphyrinogen decarboxylase (Drosophila melanogaster) [Cotesia congregata]|uniref:Uroporphyrinogen decarboxylase n=1 Tax=Cotesia congregata TaxID=51543 RepID=A0A8J2MH53_COTCN|nr:Similar to Urod: Uroporphyrinogen decarboxylase (Drosophila melanogaster) [Cotesia congregata]